MRLILTSDQSGATPRSVTVLDLASCALSSESPYCEQCAKTPKHQVRWRTCTDRQVKGKGSCSAEHVTAKMGLHGARAIHITAVEHVANSIGFLLCYCSDARISCFATARMHAKSGQAVHFVTKTGQLIHLHVQSPWGLKEGATGLGCRLWKP